MLYTWHQSNNSVVITFSTPARISREDVIAELDESSVGFQAGVDGYVLHIDGALFAPCKSVKVTLKESANQASLHLEKQTPGKWSSLLSSISETAVPRARVLFDYVGSEASEEEGELAPLYANELLQVVTKDESGWWEGIKLQMTGVFPSNFVVDVGQDYQEPEDVEASAEFSKLEESQQISSQVQRVGISVMGDELKNKLFLRKTAAFSKEKNDEEQQSTPTPPAVTPITPIVPITTSTPTPTPPTATSTPQPATENKPAPPQQQFVAVQPSNKKKPPPAILRSYSTVQPVESSTTNNSNPSPVTPILSQQNSMSNLQSQPSSTPTPSPNPTPAPTPSPAAVTPLSDKEKRKSVTPDKSALLKEQKEQKEKEKKEEKERKEKEKEREKEREREKEKDKDGDDHKENRLTSLFKKPLKKITAVANFVHTGDGKKDGKTVRAQVLYEFETDNPGELPLKVGEIITILSKDTSGWWQGSNSSGQQGWFSHTFVEEIKEEPQPVQSQPPKKEQPPPPKKSSSSSSSSNQSVLHSIKPDTPKLEHVRKAGAVRGRKPPSRSRASYLLPPDEREEREKMRGQYYSLAPRPLKDSDDSSPPPLGDVESHSDSEEPALTTSTSPLSTSQQIEKKPPPTAPRRAPISSSSGSIPNNGGASGNNSSSSSGAVSPISQSGDMPPPLADLSGSSDSVTEKPAAPQPDKPAVVMKPKVPIMKKPPPRAAGPVPPPSTSGSSESSTNSAPSPSPTGISATPPNLPQLSDEDRERVVAKPMMKPTAKPRPAAAPPAVATSEPAESSDDSGIDTSKPELMKQLRPRPPASSAATTTDKESTPATTTTDGGIDTSKPELMKQLKPRPPAAGAPPPSEKDGPAQPPASPVPVRPKPPPVAKRDPKLTSSGNSTPATSPPNSTPASVSPPPTQSTLSPPSEAVTTPSEPEESAAPVIVTAPASPPTQPLSGPLKPMPKKTTPRTSPTASVSSPIESIFKDLTLIVSQVESVSLPETTFQHQYPALPNNFLSIYAQSVDGKHWTNDNSPQPTKIPLFQLIWPFIYCILCEEIGQEEISKYISDVPLESKFDKPFTSQKKAHNPFCIGGNLVESHLLSNQYPNAAQRISKVILRLQQLVSGSVSCDMSCYLSQKSESSDEVTTAHLIKSAGLIKQPDDILDIYYQLNSIQMSPAQIAQLAATIAGEGLSSATSNKLCNNKSTINSMLTTLKTCDPSCSKATGSYELLQLSNDSGVMMLIVPGVLGLAVCTTSTKSPEEPAASNQKHIEFCNLFIKSLAK